MICKERIDESPNSEWWINIYKRLQLVGKFQMHNYVNSSIRSTYELVENLREALSGEGLQVPASHADE